MKRLPVEDLEQIYQNTQDVWESFRGKSIFMTGGTGFFGKWLLESFIYVNEKLALNARITTLTRNPEAFLKKYPFFKENINTVQFVKGDILNYDFNLEEKFQFIIHAATAASESLNKNNPLLMIDTITIGTRKILDFAISQPIDSFLFVSSGAIYGKQPCNVLRIKESDSFKIDINNLSSAYAEGKRVAEFYCSTYFNLYKLPLKIARCFAFVGPYLPLDKHFAIGNFIRDCLCGNDIHINGDGTPFRSYLYAADLTSWLWKILVRGKLNTPYNVGSADEISIASLALAVGKFNPRVRVALQKQADPTKPVERYVPDVQFIMQDLGISSYTDIISSIHKTLDFHGFNFEK